LPLGFAAGAGGEDGHDSGRCRPFEVDDGGDQEGLDLPVGQAVADGAGEAVPALGLARMPETKPRWRR
jgi:hypothetical protein